MVLLLALIIPDVALPLALNMYLLLGLGYVGAVPRYPALVLVLHSPDLTHVTSLILAFVHVLFCWTYGHFVLVGLDYLTNKARWTV